MDSGGLLRAGTLTIVKTLTKTCPLLRDKPLHYILGAQDVGVIRYRLHHALFVRSGGHAQDMPPQYSRPYNRGGLVRCFLFSIRMRYRMLLESSLLCRSLLSSSRVQASSILCMEVISL